MVNQIVVALSLSLVFICISFMLKYSFVLIFTSKEQRSVLKSINLRFIIFEFLILLLLLFPFIFLIVWRNANSYDVISLMLLIITVSVAPTYNYLIEPIYKYKLSNGSQSNTTKYDFLILNNEDKIRFIESDSEIINAFATGIIPYSKTIILGKGIINLLNEKELKTIIFHEYGHLKMNHLLKLYIVNLITNALFIILFIQFKDFLNSTDYAVLYVGGFWSLATGVYLLISSFFHKKFEKEADLFSAKVCGKKPLISTLRKLNYHTNGKMSNKSLTHPTLEQRINNIKYN